MVVTTEIRRDPITGRPVLIDRIPFQRRDAFALEAVRLQDSPATCPLCEGREADAGHEILAWRDSGMANTPGWSVRVVPSRHPMLKIEAGMDVATDGLLETREGLGAHEVIIDTPFHDRPLQSLAADRLWRVFWAWRTRVQDLKRDSRFASVVIFENHGRASGARIDHAHSQLIALPLLPPALAEKIGGAADYLAESGRCIYCDHIAAELKDGRRVIGDHAGILALAPFASRVPFETWLVPSAHVPRFEEVSNSTLEALASAFLSVMARIDWALERPAYNLILHTAPLAGGADGAFHWHLEILPRVTRFGGLEWGSGMHRNPVAPEEAAEVLRHSGRAGV